MVKNNDYTNDIRNVNIHLFERYKKVLLEFEDITTSVDILIKLIELCDKAITRVDDFTIDKHSRWLGYIQGSLASTGWIDVQEERDYSRVLYQEVYKKYNIQQETI